MKFIVKRTSQWSSDEAPCPEAKPTTVAVWDRRMFKTPEEHDRQMNTDVTGKWLERGTEHGTWVDGERSGIMRRLPDQQAWSVTITSLKALMKFQDKYGDLVLTTNMWSDEPELEIYDDYRE